MKQMRCIVAVVWSLVAVAAAAQSTGGTISGTIADDTGATLPGVTVTIRQVNTGATRVIVTESDGRYSAQALQPGTYEIAAELASFQTKVLRDVNVSLGRHAVINLVLELGQVEESITVTEHVPLVETTQGGLSSLVEQQQIRDLPLNGRDFAQLTLLQPGVLPVTRTGGSVDRGMGAQLSVAGGRPNQVSFLLDGADVNSQGNQAPGSAAGGMLGVETLREFEILTNNYSAEYGRSAGGVVSAVTRSGTNGFQGAVFEFHRNDSFDARRFFDPADEPIPPFTRNQFGGYLGGRIKRDRTFFFGSYEGLRQNLDTTSILRVPSRATRARTDINPAIAPYLHLYPLPNGPETGQTGIFTTTASDTTGEDYFVVKVDHSFSSNNSVSVRYMHDDATQVDRSGLGLWSTRRHTLGQFVVGQHTAVLTSKLLNVLRAGWNRPFEEELADLHFPDDPSLYFIPGTRIGTITVSGMTGLGPDTGTPSFIDYKSLQVMDTLTYTAGAHTIKTGFSWTRWFNDQDSTFVFGGSYRFNSVDDFIRGRTNTFEGMAPGTSTARRWRQNLIGMFVQDDYAVSERLTVNAGLRYEFITEPKEKDDLVAHMKSALEPATTVGYPLFNNPSLKNFAPRLGFAWDVLGDGRTSVRGGAGMFYEPILGNMYRAYGKGTPPFMYEANVASPPFPNPLSATFVPLNRLDLFDWDPENPVRVQYNVTLQREVLPQTVVMLGYVGSRGYHQIRNIEANQSIPTILPDGRYFFPPGPTGGAPPRRNRNFESIRQRPTDGNSWFNSVTASARKRFSQGLQFQGSYTFGRSRDEGSQAVGSADFNGSSQPRYGEDRHDNYGRSDFDLRHNFVLNYSWELPFGDGLSGAAGALAGGWQLSGIVSLRSGIAFTPVLGFDRARARPRSGGAGQRPNWAPAYSADNVILGGVDRYFDRNAFVLPDAGYFGDVPRNILEGPGFATWDMALLKNLRFSKYRAQLRFEAFNVLNRANFGQPASTVFDSRGPVEGAGEITTTIGTARQLQIGVKLEF